MKRALVTGGSGDIGSAICRRLAADGLHVIVQANHHPDRAEALVDEILQVDGSAQTVVFDVTDTTGVRQVLESVLEAGPVQILVNNAGIYADAPLAGMSFEQWHRVIDVCLNGFFNVTQPLLLPMLRTRWGRVINISSVAAILGNRGQTNYAAAKAGLHGATRALALELASRGITVNAVAPGIIAGHITRQVFDAALIKRLVPMQRAGMPDEVAALVAFLASEEAGYISGQIINVNGFMA
ncbi:MAG: 3-oxoacyl-ACP reductase FabG [Candidatus Competibacteraceae bacterium]